MLVVRVQKKQIAMCVTSMCLAPGRYRDRFASHVLLAIVSQHGGRPTVVRGGRRQRIAGLAEVFAAQRSGGRRCGWRWRRRLVRSIVVVGRFSRLVWQGVL